MTWLLAGIAGIALVELVGLFPIRRNLRHIKATAIKIFATLRSGRISDHWKEKVLLRYAERVFTLTLSLAFYLIIALAPFFAAYGLSLALNVHFLDFTLSFIGILFVSITAIGYARLRFRRVANRL
jgi:hypothetical protein